MVDLPKGIGDVLDFSDLETLLKLTATRAQATQETVSMLDRILQGQRGVIVALEGCQKELGELSTCSRRIEGVSVAMAGYLASRNGQDLAKLQVALDAMEADPEGSGGDIHVHVKQTGGTQIGEVKAKAKRNVSLAGGDVKEGSG